MDNAGLRQPDEGRFPFRSETGESTGESPPRHVLVVEDVPSLQKLLVTVLKKSGFAASTADNGQEAIDLVARCSFDAVLMDVQMPGMSGLEATRAIRAREAESGGYVPIVAITAHALAGDAQTCREAGVDEYLRKPVDFAELISLLNRLTA